MKIAIDGPASSGKSTVGLMLSKKLGCLFFDTGVMYRVITLAALKEQIDLHNAALLGKLAEQIRINVTQPQASITDNRPYTVWLDEQDVTWEIRQPEVDGLVSVASAYPEVRREMVKQQRQIACGQNIVMVGRDIGTVVLPEATVKIYL